MGRQAFHGEGAGDADLLLVLVGLVVEVFEFGLGGDGGVDFLLACNARLPPVGVEFSGGIRPFGVGVAGDFPLLPCRRGGFQTRPYSGVQLFAQRFQLRLPLVPDDVDLGVVGDGFQGDVRHALVDEAVAEVAARGLAGGRGAGDCGFLDLAVATVGEQVVGIAGAHDAGTCQCEGDAGGVEGDPTAAPLFRDVGGGAGTAGGVEDEVAGVCGHEDAALNDACGRLDNVNLGVIPSLNTARYIIPIIRRRKRTEVVKVLSEAKF